MRRFYITNLKCESPTGAYAWNQTFAELGSEELNEKTRHEINNIKQPARVFASRNAAEADAGPEMVALLKLRNAIVERYASTGAVVSNYGIATLAFNANGIGQLATVDSPEAGTYDLGLYIAGPNGQEFDESCDMLNGSLDAVADMFASRAFWAITRVEDPELSTVKYNG